MESDRKRKLRDALRRLGKSDAGEQRAILDDLVGEETDDALKTAAETHRAEAGEAGSKEAVLPAQDLLGEKVGKIRVVEVLGEGGMGKVYAGWDEKLKRRVALKSIRRHHAFSREAKARFLREAQILSRLKHPNICQIYDYIEGDRTDFLILEFIDGVDLQRLLKRGLEESAKMGIALQIADVVVAAHAEGVIHRDLKPANVMVTTGGQVKVLDFGIARCVGEDAATRPLAEDDLAPVLMPADGTVPLRTATGSVVGTPHYMSPEQAQGQAATAASDMFSVGLLLQELFTGKRPYDTGLHPAKLLEDVSKGRSLPVTGLDPELTTLLERLKSTLPGVRPSALDTLHRLQWIHDAPQRRRLRRLRIVGTAFLALVAAAMTFLAVRIQQEAERANREAERARVEATTSEQVVELLVSLFEASDPFEEESGLWQARAQELTVRQVLDRGAERISFELGDQPHVRARLEDSMGSIYHHLGLFQESGDLLEKALETRQELLADDQPGLAESLQHLGALRRDTGRYEEADELLSRALSLREGDTETDPLAVADSLDQLATLRSEQGRLEEAEDLYSRGLVLREAALGAGDLEVAESLNSLGSVYDRLGRLDEAERLIRRALEIRESRLGRDHPVVAWSLNSLGIVLDQKGSHDEALEAWQRALRLTEDNVGADHPGVAVVLANLAILHNRQGRYDEAERSYQRARERYVALFGPDHPRVGEVLGNLGGFYLLQGQYRRSEPLFREARRIFEGAFGAEHPAVAMCVGSLAILAARLDRSAEAEGLYREALAVFGATLGSEHPEVARTSEGLAQALFDGDKVDEGRRVAEGAVALTEKVLGSEHPDLAAALVTLADAELRSGRADAAAPLLLRAEGILAAGVEADNGRWVRWRQLQGELLRQRGELDAADRHLEEAIGLLEKKYHPEHPALIRPLRARAELARERGARRQAEELALRLGTLEKVLAASRSGI